MPAKLHTIFLLFLVLFGLISCFKKEEYPLEPIVNFKSFVVGSEENKAVITFDFTDGDGDLGLLESDTLDQFSINGDNYHNFILTYFEKDDKLGWVQGQNIEGTPIVLNFRLKPILDYSISKGVKGTISYDFDFYYNFLSDQSDTIMYEFQIIDRALNKSNIGKTTAIVTS
ncbi:MAG: hypothetical protein AB8B74_01710 [Crocinitomicaceae bacterium]